MNFRHFLLSTLIIFCSSLPVKADHGGALDMSYRCLGGGKYEITLKFYRDCSGAAMISSYSAFLDTYYGVGANIDIDWSSSCGSGTITFPKPTNVTAATNYVGPEVTFLCPTGKSTCNGGTTPGFQYYEYIDTITLGTCTGNITFGYGVCNRSCSINTIITPCSSCAYVDAMLNNSGGCNSSPVFSNVPLPVACVGQKFCFNPGAIDADGDSLVYSLINARGGTSVSSSWTDVVTYMPPYSGTNPIATSGGVTINKTTGDICFTPTTQQIGVIAIQVDEYRNKKKVGYVVRDMQIYIKACTNNMPIMSGIDNTTSFSTTACKDSPICFDVFSSDADAAQNVSISWNNGIPGATFTSSGGSRPKGTFCWTPTAANVRPSPYVFTVTVKDDNCPNVGVQVFTYQINVTNCVGPQVNITSASVCSGGCTNITANTSGGATPYTYNWSGGGSTTSVLNVCPTATTTYSVTVTDNSGATKTAAATVTVSSPMTLTTSKVDSKCSGANNGTATALPTGGSTPLTYSWSTTPVQTTITATNLAPGTYIVTTTDSKGCTKTSTAVITEPPAVTLTPSSTNTSCNGSADGTASVIPNGGSGPYTYTWAPSGGAGQTATSLPAATYTVTVTDSKGCTKSATTAVAQPSAINLSLSKTDIKCNGGSTGTLSVNVNGGSSPYSYSWSPAGGNGATASSLLVGTYTVVVTDTKGCTTSSSSSITEPAAMSLLTNSSPANCGVNDGSVGVTPNGGISPYTYLWTPGGGSTAIISNVAGGSYTVLVTDSKGCSTSTTAIVASSGGATITATSTNVTCYNGNDGTASAAATGGTPGYAYSWSNGATSQTVSGLISGTYSVTVTDANNCPAISTTVITQPSAVTGTVSVVSSTCGNPNGSATVTPNGGQGAYSFSWSSGGVTATESGLSATTYTVTVFDGSACTGTASATITNVGGGVPTASVVTNVTCNGGNDGSATVNIAGGTIPFTYSWSSAQNTQTISGLTQGSYTVTIGDASTCTSTSVVTITEPAAINDPTFVTNNANCGVNNGSAIASASGGAGSLTYTWSNSVAGPTNNNIAANSYTVTVKDANGCTKTGVANVSNNGGPTVNSITPTAVTCNGAKTGSVTVNISSGNPSYTYSWSEGTNSTTTDVQSTISNVAAGNYAVTVTDANSCQIISTVTITEPDAISILFTTTPAACGQNNGSATAAPTGGTGTYSYLWNDGQTTSTATNLSVAVYTLTVTDGNGCVQTSVTSISNANAPSAATSVLQPIACNGGTGSTTVTVSNGTIPYTYSWNTGPSLVTTDLQFPLNNIGAGSYTVTITDSKSCQVISTVTLTQPDSLSITATSTPSQCGKFNGTSTALANGGSPGFTYGWSSSQSGASINGLTSGTYTVTATDKNGCTTTTTTTVNDTIFTIGYNIPPSQTVNEGTAVIITLSGGVTYTWSPADGLSCTTCQNVIAQPATSTTYTIFSTDAYGCTATVELTILVKEPCNDSKDLFIANVFSPNDDGKNDVLRIEGSGLTNIYWAIYDRWGNVLFEAFDQTHPWDGTKKGNAVDSGVYVYYLRATCVSTHSEIKLKGNVTIIR